MRRPTAFPDRAQRLANILSGLDVGDNFPLLKAARLLEAQFAAVQEVVDQYLQTTLQAYYPDKHFARCNAFFERHLAAIQSLPNITPNGIILPKRETYHAYNHMHAGVADLFDELAVEPYIDGLQTPINLRIVDGTPDPVKDTRARASVKMHSDMWAGEPANAIMVFLPIFDAAGKIGVRWIEPRAFPEEFMGPLDDFDEGRHLADGGSEYAAGFRAGDLVLADPFLIHATQKNAPGARLSIDFRFTAACKLESDAPAPGLRQRSYSSYADWAEIGRGRLLATQARLEPFTGDDEPTKNAYAAEFEIISFDD